MEPDQYSILWADADTSIKRVKNSDIDMLAESDFIHICTNTDTGSDIWNCCTSRKQKCFIGEGMEYQSISILHENIYKSVINK